ASKLTPIEIGDSSKLNVGEWVMAIGSPFGNEQSVSTGIVSALYRSTAMSSTSGNTIYANMIQTDAAINPGNSGGALVNDNGELVGINSLIESYSGSSSGVGFAIPVNYAKNIADQIIDGKTPVHPYLGATLSSVNALNARTNNLGTDSGAYVASVVEDGPAAKAGIQEGDVITKLGDDEITSADGLIIALRSHEVGEKVEITLVRGKEEKKVTVELGSDEELQNQQQNDSATDTGNGGITDEQLRQYLEELLGQQGQGQGYGQGF
ncbi:MAG: PDZ domain-containing protein, partial [Collinsella sp.]|nr:PDZ domain-containing protein [Collinsella sp.]